MSNQKVVIMFDRTGEITVELTKPEALLMIEGLCDSSNRWAEEDNDDDRSLELSELAVRVRQAIGCEECGESIFSSWGDVEPYTCNACDKKINPEDYKED